MKFMHTKSLVFQIKNIIRYRFLSILRCKLNTYPKLQGGYCMWCGKKH